METFIVRIYRRNLKDPDKVDGQVEMAGTEGSKNFHNMAELCRLLTPRLLKKQKKKNQRSVNSKTGGAT